jgi:hypothetical protein
MTTLLTLLIGALAGLHTSSWGMYKDAPHEGFTVRTFARSLLVSTLLAPVLVRLLGLAPTDPASVVLLFGAVYAAERAVTETWKTCFRNQSQAKYAIPMQLAVFGRPIESRWFRRMVGTLYLGGIVSGLWLLSSIDPPRGFSPMALAFTFGALGGWLSAFGGAWKDAPIEGFQPFKFVRSPAIAAGYAWLLFLLGGSLVEVTLAATGYTVATCETWKTFCFPSSPRGKFAGKPVRFPAFLRLRVLAVPGYVTIWLLVLAAFTAAFRRVMQ